MNLCIELCEPWNTLANNGSIEARFECWCVGDSRVFCFNQTGSLEPYENSGLKWEARAARVPFKKHIVRYCGNDVAAFDNFDKFVVRLYLHMPESPDMKAPIPHHVANALVFEQGLAPKKVSLFSHADANWIKPQVIQYGHVYLEYPSKLDIAPTTLHHDNALRNMETVFTGSIWPDLAWIHTHKPYMHESVRHMAVTPPFESLGCGPILTMEHAATTSLDPEYHTQFCSTSGATAASTWRLDRGMGVAPASTDFLEERLREAIHLRGRRDPDAWDAEFEKKHHLVVDEVEEFMLTVQKGLIGPNPLLPGGHHKGMNVLHNWVREAIENVFYALGSLAVSRRYVFDHRWVPTGKHTGHFFNDVKYNMLTDENTLGFTIPGDCEDSNSVIYYLALHMMQQHYPADSLLYYAKICLIVAGIPCCVVGSSMAPSVSGDELAKGSHLYGFSIPFRIFARMVWGKEVTLQECKQEMEYLAGCEFSDFVVNAAFPMVMETICFTTPDYLDPSTWKRDDHKRHFNAFVDCMTKNRQDVVFPRIMGANWPLSITRTDTSQGFIVHGRIVRLFTAGIPLCFSTSFRARHTALEISDIPTLCAPNTTDDPLLQRTIAFIPVSHCEDAARKINVDSDEYNNIGILTLSLYDSIVHARLATCKRISPQVLQADADLVQYDRPFVTIHNRVDIHEAMSKADSWPFTHAVSIPTHPKDRFTVFIYADRVDKGGKELMDALLATRDFYNRPISIRRFCWAVAIVISL